ncbi:MAG: putative high-affinity branched-chain amino acid transport protein superfamily, atp bind [Frankiales bacterium]|nr:putative high-affinity branched-chain amino acid transport protein superfamily, atp bind [Frankiales bacterium]
MTTTTVRTAPVLEARGLTVGYGAMAVVHDLDLTVSPGEVVALLGVNGAGKSTTVRALAGELKPLGGEVWLHGQRTTAPLHRRARQGMRYISEERSVFMNLSAGDNLRMGRTEKQRCLELFPELERLLSRKAGLLSGGEQQMLTLARALSVNPKVLLADELSLGLAPLVLERLLLEVRAAADRGSAVLLVEQHVRDALEVAYRAYVLSHGRVVLEGDAKALRGRIGEIEQTYLAGAELEIDPDDAPG